MSSSTSSPLQQPTTKLNSTPYIILSTSTFQSSSISVQGAKPKWGSTSTRPYPAICPATLYDHSPIMSLSKFRTLLTTISTPKQKPAVTTTVRLLQAHNINNTQSTKMSTGTPNPAPNSGQGPLKPSEPKQSMIGGHAQYVKGMVNEKIGAVTGNEAWVESGQKDMAEGRGAMKVCTT